MQKGIYRRRPGSPSRGLRRLDTTLTCGGSFASYDAERSLPELGKAVVALVQFPRTPAITQGTIFVGGVAEDYEDCRTYGLIITARCDAVNEKTRIYNYLPVVHFDDWLQRDGALILADRICSDTRNSMKNVLRSIQLSPSIIETEDPARILQLSFVLDDKRTANAKQRFSDLCEKWANVQKLSGLLATQCPYIELAEIAQNLSEQLVREIVQHKLIGYYFFSRIDPDGDDLGYVVMLREVRSVTKSLAELLRSGISSSDFEEMCRIEPTHQRRLNVQTGDFAMPVSVVESPHMEHLMQVFSTLFGRIGIPDTPTEYLQSLCDRQPSFRSTAP